ncbi:hypothetical protein CHH83_02245 [Bacillus sp. 7586-K]|nr:hypothetical protein CHH83_02245 [Bacillus sp. 7586-K]
MLTVRAALLGHELKTLDGFDKHIYSDGSRDHVLSYSSNGIHCSQKNCVVNRDKTTPQIKESIFL